ncbi:MAG: FtsW/RodA/SpoVE family cell cycle protein [Bacteroidales bacterium]|nr:FtsW/RodA/SpoVE family cell cycle protein [Candidatus Hennigimonas equi]
MDTKKSKGLLGSLAQNIKDGDRVIWIIVVLLMLFSLVAIFSSTSLLAIKEKVSRVDIFAGQLKIVAAGCVILILFSALPNIRLLRFFSRWGFIVSLVLLIFLNAGLSIGDSIKVITVNNATRAIRIGGFSLQVFEVVKVAMVMYLAWAIQAYESGKFKWAIFLGTAFPGAFGWMKDPRAQRWIYIFIPMMLVMILILPGSTGSAALTGIIMFATILIGGLKIKDIMGPVLLAVTGLALIASLHIVSSGKIMPRFQTACNRLKIELPYPDHEARTEQHRAIELKKTDPSTLVPGSRKFMDYLDEIRQPAAAEIAIVEGGRHIIGKGPGRSTQKYVVPVMFEDYMFSFIVEEYGLLVGFLIIVMFLSLFARGAIIVKNCKNRYAQACVGGLVFLITFQAMFHIVVNCNIGLLTGQTLPLISHGRCSFLCFSIAFGVILSISKMAYVKIKKERKEEEELRKLDEVSVSMDILDNIDEQLDLQLNDNLPDEDSDSEPDKNEL